MFATKKNNENVKNTGNQVSAERNKIGSGTQINGDIISEGDFRIDGILEGSIKTSGKIVVGASGKIIGKMECINAEVEGNLEGTIMVKELLSLKSTSTINGEVIIGKLAIEPGATFDATCRMSDKATNGAAVKKEKAKAVAN